MLINPIYREHVIAMSRLVRRCEKNLASLFSAVLVVSCMTAIVVGIWDCLVWLTNSDWRSSDFKIPLYSLAVLVISCFLLGVISEVADRFGQWLDRLGQSEIERRRCLGYED